jgi:hypothetical protein
MNNIQPLFIFCYFVGGYSGLKIFQTIDVAGRINGSCWSNISFFSAYLSHLLRRM